MTRQLFSAALLLVLGGAAWAEDKPKLPKGPPPFQALARATLNKGVIEFRLTVPYLVQVFQETKTVVEGKEVIKTTVVAKLVTREDARQVKEKELQAFDATGKKVSAKALLKRLKKPGAVLVSADGAKVDPFYLEIIKKDTLVLILPSPKSEPESGLKPMPDRPKKP